MFALSSAVMAVTGQEVLKMADQAFKAPPDVTAETKMILVDSNGKEKVRDMMTWIKNFPGQDKDSWRLMKFSAPSDVKNIGFLSLDEDLMYLYMPEFKKNRRIASHNKKDSFVGSDFFYDDLSASDYSKHYDAEIISEDDSSWKLSLKLRPSSDKPYPSGTITVDKVSHMFTKGEFNDSSGQLWKILNNKNEKYGNYWISVDITMEDVKKNHKTTLRMENVKVDTKLEDKMFTERQLKRPVK